MRDTLIIRRVDGSVFLQSKLKDLPYKEEAVAAKSLELFADDDPCVIHRSFVIMQFAEEWRKVFGPENKLPLPRVQSLIDRLNLHTESSFSVELMEARV